ncbi:MAG: hypothetical protein GY928_20325 [Colwellia sp.]|nr:hypothetical protein [Colwellia sp.]
MNKEFNRFISMAGGADQAQVVLNCSDSLMVKLVKGNRDISKAIAKTIKDAYPDIDLYRLLYD